MLWGDDLEHVGVLLNIMNQSISKDFLYLPIATCLSVLETVCILLQDDQLLDSLKEVSPNSQKDLGSSKPKERDPLQKEHPTKTLILRKLSDARPKYDSK